jgi:hypothetical protein
MASDNPFAIVVLAHLQTQTTRHNPTGRFDAKLTLAKLLYRKGLSRQDILNLFRFIDWIMTLPTELEQQLQVELVQFEGEVKMRYVTTIERLAIQKGKREGLEEGLQQGLREGIINILQTRFDEEPESVISLLEEIEDTEALRDLNRQAVIVNSLAAFELLLNETL